MDEDDRTTSLVNALLKTHEDNVQIKGLLERDVAANERRARATESIEHHLETNIPAIMQALGVVREQTGSFKKEDTPTAIKVWDRFAAASPQLRWTVVVLIGVLALSGWAGHLWRWVSGGGH